jgi:hypothetical protein
MGRFTYNTQIQGRVTLWLRSLGGAHLWSYLTAASLSDNTLASPKWEAHDATLL